MWKLFNPKKGEIFSFKNVRNDIDSIEKDYSTKGYLFTKVKKVDLPTLKNPILKFIIEESTFDSVTVSGNAKTKDYVILREIDIKPGDEINEKELRKTLGEFII